MTKSTAKPYSSLMRYVWDPTKDVLNRRNHRLSLADGIPALEDPDSEFWIDSRFDYGEERIITFGRNRRSLLVVVSVEQDVVDTTRIISVRKATKHEANQFHANRR